MHWKSRGQVQVLMVGGGDDQVGRKSRPEAIPCQRLVRCSHMLERPQSAVSQEGDTRGCHSLPSGYILIFKWPNLTWFPLPLAFVSWLFPLFATIASTNSAYRSPIHLSHGTLPTTVPGKTKCRDAPRARY